MAQIGLLCATTYKTNRVQARQLANEANSGVDDHD